MHPNKLNKSWILKTMDICHKIWREMMGSKILSLFLIKLNLISKPNLNLCMCFIKEFWILLEHVYSEIT